MKIYCQKFDKIQFFINLLLRVWINGRKYSLGKQLSKVRVIAIQIIGRIFNVQSADCSGETDFVQINQMFELLFIRIIGIQLYLKDFSEF